MNLLAFSPERTSPLTLEIANYQFVRNSDLFLLNVDHQEIRVLDNVVFNDSGANWTVQGEIAKLGLAIDWRVTEISEGAWKFSLSVRNESNAVRRIRQADPINLNLTEEDFEIDYFRSAWGDEFRPRKGSSSTDTRIDARSGRSSNGHSPWIGLSNQSGALVVSPAWSGNWHISYQRGHTLSAGISPRNFYTDLRPGERFDAPSVYLAAGTDLAGASSNLARGVGEQVVPRSPWSQANAIEWNSWWPYEDVALSEEIIISNAEVAHELGIQVVNVDAGWFGRADKSSDWQGERGDWGQVNLERFPHGLEYLGEAVRSKGVEIGIWIEAEAVGASSQLRKVRPEIIAKRDSTFLPDPSLCHMTVSLDKSDPDFLGYVCLGSAGGRAYVLESMCDLVKRTGARWINLDFNIDPGDGCNSEVHGHGKADGLYAHYMGLYSVLDEFRERCPEVQLESCASGGLRFDLGMAEHVHCQFLSDPDYTEHHLQVLWGASRMLPPIGILHWSWSQWRGLHPASQKDFASVGVEEFEMIIAAAMLHRFGVSYALPDMKPKQLKILWEMIALYKEYFQQFLLDSTLVAITPQPLREGNGFRTPIFVLKNPSGKQIYAGFRLDDSAKWSDLEWYSLENNLKYRVTDLATGVIFGEIEGGDLCSKKILAAHFGSARHFFIMVEPIQS